MGSSDLLALCPFCPPLLRRGTSTRGTTHQVPPPEATRVVPNELLMVDIVMVCTSPER